MVEETKEKEEIQEEKPKPIDEQIDTNTNKEDDASMKQRKNRELTYMNQLNIISDQNAKQGGNKN